MITGQVKNTAGETLPGASVYLSDANGNMAGTIGAITDATGAFYIPTAQPGQYFTASYVGYKPNTIQVIYQTITFTLEQTSTTLPGPTVTAPSDKKLNTNMIIGLFAAVGLLVYTTTAPNPFGFLKSKKE